ncbi:MAG: hypothetical protein LBB05_01350, partial [Puniceicoccales bacterium]|nr:hypothetical protein [Puniceicoccales bacterium]
LSAVDSDGTLDTTDVLTADGDPVAATDPGDPFAAENTAGTANIVVPDGVALVLKTIAFALYGINAKAATQKILNILFMFYILLHFLKKILRRQVLYFSTILK